MTAFVVDTNVAVVANGKSDEADKRCELACTDKLESLRKVGVCLDSGGLILQEYMRNLSLSGQPGVGDWFIKWISDNQYNSHVCERVAIREHHTRGFEEFPSDRRLKKFHADDRKFVAVALASQQNPTILNATDSDWSDHQIALDANGVKVEELCPDCLKGACNGEGQAYVV